MANDRPVLLINILDPNWRRMFLPCDFLPPIDPYKAIAHALDRGDLLRVATQDRLHQPYRMEACPLLPLLLPLAGESGILGVSLSGAGPAVLLIAASGADTTEITARILSAAADPSIEIVETSIGCGASQSEPA